MSAAALRDWLQANPRAPLGRELAARVIASADPDLWPAGAEPVPLFVAARDALRRAKAETSRQPQDEEAAALDAVARNIAALREAIERAPLPRGSAIACFISGGGRRPEELLIGWRDVPDDLERGSFSTSIVDMLAVADDMLQQHRATLPLRAVKRHRDRPMAGAFVRWMDYIARRRDLPATATTLAAWCSVLTGESVAARDVRVILRDAPRELKTPPRPR